MNNSVKRKEGITITEPYLTGGIVFSLLLEYSNREYNQNIIFKELLDLLGMSVFTQNADYKIKTKITNYKVCKNNWFRVYGNISDKIKITQEGIHNSNSSIIEKVDYFVDKYIDSDETSRRKFIENIIALIYNDKTIEHTQEFNINNGKKVQKCGLYKITEVNFSYFIISVILIAFDIERKNKYGRTTFNTLFKKEDLSYIFNKNPWYLPMHNLNIISSRSEASKPPHHNSNVVNENSKEKNGKTIIYKLIKKRNEESDIDILNRKAIDINDLNNFNGWDPSKIYKLTTSFKLIIPEYRFTSGYCEKNNVTDIEVSFQFNGEHLNARTYPSYWHIQKIRSEISAGQNEFPNGIIYFQKNVHNEYYQINILAIAY